MTPHLSQGPILQCFGEIGTNCPDFKKVLAGKFPLKTVDNIYVQKLLRQLQNPETVREVPLRLLQECIHHWMEESQRIHSPLIIRNSFWTLYGWNI